MSARAQVELWCIHVGRAVRLDTRLSTLLDHRERDRACRFVKPEDALRYRVAHGALRVILSRYTGIDAQHIRFSSGEHGKPRLCDGGPFFNLSHSGALALVAVCADGEVGVDVEEVRAVPKAVALARRFFSPVEARAIAAEPTGCRDFRFMRSWTALEAILKAEQTGLAGADGGVQFQPCGGDRARASIAAITGSPTWSVCWPSRLPHAPRYVAAVAAGGDHVPLRLRCFA